MADVSKIKLTDNTEYDIKDAIARQSIATTDEKTDEIIEQLNNPTYTTTEGTDLIPDTGPWIFFRGPLPVSGELSDGISA